jgi:hypothetical protein
MLVIIAEEEIMIEHVSVSQAIQELNEQYGLTVHPQDLSNLFYRRELRHDLCPIVGGRRLIPRDYLPLIAATLQQRGNQGQRGEVTND